ncbi:MAG: cytochrome d ubiquinol oxidase subunit II, partial [Gemmatimonadaceae bacterium]
SIEVRSHVHDPLWYGLYDFVFTLSGALLTIFLGAALGNVIRGVPLNADGYFFEPLWTNFRVTGRVGILDWYTMLIGVMSFVTLANHGAHWLALKTKAPLRERARRIAARLWWIVAALTVVGFFATVWVRPIILENYLTPGWGSLIPVVAIGGLGGMAWFRARQKDLAAFISSSLYIAGMLGGVAFGMYPTLLPATTDPAYSLTVANSATGAYGLQVGLIWWIFSAVLVIGYFCYVYWTFRHRVDVAADATH